VGQYSFLFLSEQLNFIIIFVPPEVPRSADFWAVPGMAQNGADIIFSGILGRSGMAQNGADFIFSAHFWAVPGMAQFITFSQQDVFSTTTVNLGKILTE
jgi:hypothetical protein